MLNEMISIRKHIPRSTQSPTVSRKGDEQHLNVYEATAVFSR